MRYLVVGAGGVGGSIAACLSLSGQTVTCIVRGAHKEKMLSQGLFFHSGIKGEKRIPCQLYDEASVARHEHSVGEKPLLFLSESETFSGKADYIIIAVKGYSIDSIIPCVLRAAKKTSIVLPVLNVYGTGPRIASKCPDLCVIDGCIYILGFINAPGEVSQLGNVFRLVFGARQSDPVTREELLPLYEDLLHAGIKVELSDDIRRDTFSKWCFISAMACTGAYFNTTMKALQHDGAEREMFKGLIRESASLADALDIRFDYDPMERNLAILDSLDPDSTASLQKDLLRGKDSEIQGQLFDLLSLCQEKGIPSSTYETVARKFAYLRNG